jgi:predicted phosphodiesterase
VLLPLLWACGAVTGPAQPAAAPTQGTAPNGICGPIENGSIRFAVIGDSGTGDDAQQQVADAMVRARQVFPFDFVIMLGDNLYGSERPQDYVRKFERPYKLLLDAGVEFYATLGNHDDPNQRYYKPFHMNGRRYYTFTKGPIRFYVLDSSYFDEEQLEWIARELQQGDEPWKIAYFHHPLYSSGAKHGAEEDLRERLEPLFVAHWVSVVFSGHEHFYERLQPQKGIHYFTSGAAAKLRVGNIRPGELTAKGLDREYSFMVAEVAGDVLRFQTITRVGRVFDSGVIRRRGAQQPTDGARPTPAGVEPLVCSAA